MDPRNSGFTLIEMAIVLVIVGLLIGGVLAGQQLHPERTGAQSHFPTGRCQGRLLRVPGPLPRSARRLFGASLNINCSGSCFNERWQWSDRVAASIRSVTEHILAWSHLAAAGFINGSYTTAASNVTTAAPGNTPTNPFGAYMQVAYDGLWGVSANALGTPVLRHSIKTGNQVPVEIIAEVDRKIDDGNPNTGAFQFSTFIGTGPRRSISAEPTRTAAPAVTTPTASWQVTNGQSNCGGASLL
mgnify:CR=1 FL=1